MIAGLSPAVESLRPRLSESLKGSSGAVTSGRRRSRLRSALVAVQIALSLLLLVQAGALHQGAAPLFLLRPGIRDQTGPQHHVRVGLVGLPSAWSPSTRRSSRVCAAFRASSIRASRPWRHGRGAIQRAIARDRRHADSRRPGTIAGIRPAGWCRRSIFAALDIPLTRGRVFTREELSSTSEAVPAVISEAMARRYWPGQDPVGHQLRIARVTK